MLKKSIPDVGSDCTALRSQTDSAGAISSSSSALFDKFFLFSKDLVCLADMDGRFKKVNRSLVDLLGYSEVDLLDESFINFIHPHDTQILPDITAFINSANSNNAFECRFYCHNGSIKWLSWSMTVLNDDKMLLAIGRDITDKKQFEEELKGKSSALNQELKDVIERYKVFVQQSSEIIWRCELQKPLNIHDTEEQQLQQLFEGYIAECNDQMAHFYGYANAADVIGKKVSVFFDPNEPVTLKVVREFIEQGYKLYRRLSGHIDHAGNKRYFLNNLVGVVEQGMLLRVWTTQNEITQQRLAEKAISESEERFRQFANSAPVIIWVSDEVDNTIYVNKCFEQFTGVTLNEVAGDKWENVIHPADIPVAIEKYKSYFKYREPVVLEYRLKNVSGEYRWVLDHGVPRFLEDGTFVGYIGSIVDIHDRKLAEEKIRFQVQVMQDVSEGIISTDLDFTVISFNKAAENIYGIQANEIVGKHLHNFIDLCYVSNTWEEALTELHEKGNWEGQAYYNREDGKRIYLYCSLSFVKNERGTRIGFAGIYRDITEARQSQEALRINEERYRSVVHALGEGILMLDKSGEIIACNHSAGMILGVNGDQLVSRNATIIESLCIYEDGSTFPTEQHPAFITLKTGKSLQNVIMGVQRTDGVLVWISINTEPVYYTQQRVHPDAVVASFVDITQKKAAEIELKRSQQQLKEYSERITNILASITDGFIAVDKNHNIILWNHEVEHITGLDAKNVIGLGVEKIFPNFAGTAEYRQFVHAVDKGTTVTFEHFISLFNRWLETSVYPFSQGAFIYFRDITGRKKQERLLELEKEVLKMNAQPAASLKTTVDYFLDGLEKTFPDMLCSVITLNDDKQTVQHLSAPNLPVDYALAINGTKIGPAVGSCGTAIYRKEKVITVDIDNDPLWINFRELAAEYGLKSCWSFPIINAANEVLATIAVYHRYPASPDQKDVDLFERISSLLRVIIENKNAESKIRLSNERYLLVTKATNDAIWDWDVNTNTLYWGEGIYTLFGFNPGYLDKPDFWENCIHPEDRDRVINGLNEFLKSNTSQTWEDEYRFIKPNGECALVYDRGFLIFDHSGKITRMVGSMQDITDKKELERKLLKQEVDKQKLIAQAVVNAQEKERAEIGKELHDNVNQILSTAKLYLELAQTDDDSRLELIDRSTKNISDAINEIRTVSRSLVPPSVGDLGLVDSIQDLVENIKATRKLHVEFYYSGSIDSLLDEKRKLMLFRIIQEQVNNVLKHASAKNLVIELIADREGHVVDLTISDDGNGFELDKVRSKKGVGLSNIASRAQLFNGSVNIVTALGKGCKLKINVPISNI
jgi:PAS domain S-box-containing protein